MKRIIPNLKTYSKEGRVELIFWHDCIVFTMLLVGVIVGTIIMFPCLIYNIKSENWILVILSIILYFCTVYLFISPQIKYKIRALFILFITYALGLVIINTYGPMSGGPSWLFTFGVLAGLLFGLKGALISIGINILTLTIIGIVFGKGFLNPTFLFFDTLLPGIVTALNFILLNAATSISVAVLLNGLKSIAKKELSLRKKLEEKHKIIIKAEIKLRKANLNLEKRVQTRTKELNDTIKLLESEVEEHTKTAKERENLLTKLQLALNEVKQLSGLLPICASCKKIRDENGEWHDVAVYIHNHSEAEFSHGICPECGEKLYPEYFNKK